MGGWGRGHSHLVGGWRDGAVGGGGGGGVDGVGRGGKVNTAPAAPLTPSCTPALSPKPQLHRIGQVDGDLASVRVKARVRVRIRARVRVRVRVREGTFSEEAFIDVR